MQKSATTCKSVQRGQPFAAAGRWLALLATTLLCAPSSAWSADKPGPWNGQWEVKRDHPQITTRGAALALELEIAHSAGSATPRVKWAADRGLCESPTAPPCDWIGNHGVASSARVVGGHLLLVLPVSADDSDPMVVWLERPQPGRSTPGVLISAKGNLAYTLAVERP